MLIMEKSEEKIITALIKFSKGEIGIFLDTVIMNSKPITLTLEEYKEIIITKSPSSEFEEVLQKLYSLIDGD